MQCARPAVAARAERSECDLADDPDLAMPYVICSLADLPSRRAVGFRLLRIAEDGTERLWPILVVRWGRQVFGYVNRCPHGAAQLDWERDQFLDPNGTRLMCGKHGALFEIGSGRCVEGPCAGESLEPVAVCVLDDDICVLGVRLAEEDEPAEPTEA